MNGRQVYVERLIPKIEQMQQELSEYRVGLGRLRTSIIDICGCLNDLVDYIFWEHTDYINKYWCSDNVKQFRDTLEKRNIEYGSATVCGSLFGIVRDVANTSKHKKIGREEATVRSIESLKECVALVLHKDDKGYYYAPEAIVLVETRVGLGIPMDIPINSSFQMLTMIMMDAGAIPNVAPINMCERNFYATRHTANVRSTKIRGRVGESFEIPIKKYVYDVTLPFSKTLHIRAARKDEKFSSRMALDLATIDGYFPES